MIKSVVGLGLLTVGAGVFAWALGYPGMVTEAIRAIVWAGSSLTLGAAAVTGVFLISGRRS